MHLPINYSARDGRARMAPGSGPACPAIDADGEVHGGAAQMLQFQSALIALRDADMDNLPAFLRLMTEQAALALDAERVGFWRLNETGDAIVCEDLFVRSTCRHQWGDEVRRERFPVYFGAIQDHVAIRADDAWHHPATLELAEVYLQPLGISSMLDVPVKRGGLLKGVVCVEHIGAQRRWSPAEENFAIAVAGMAALAIEHAKRLSAEARLKELNQQLQQLVAQRTRALQDSEERFHSIFEHSPMLVILTSMVDGTITEINPAALLATGRTWPEAIGRSLVDLGIEVARAQPAVAPPPGAMPGGPVSIQVELRRGDGERLILLGSCRSLAIGATMHWLYCLQDITGREQAREALDRLTAELEQRVEERTAALREAKSAAERANATKSRFLSHMSHELRTPLNAILGFAQLMGAEGGAQLSPRQQRCVGEIRLAGTHLLTLINDVLDLSRIEAGRLPIRHEPVALAEVVAECLGLVEPLAAARQITMQGALAAAPSRPVLADRVRLKQVLLNLLSNAIKYNRPGGRVRLAASAEGGLVRLAVSDEGPGIDAAQQQRLFQAFERLDADRTAIDGTGIGLALCRQLMEAMQGEIGVDSQPGQGSTFWLRLPAAAAPPAAPGPTAAVAAAAAAAAPQAPEAPFSVLYIEDNPVNILIMQGMLGQLAHCRLTVADLPEQGLGLALAAPPDLILLDIHLPGMDGFEVLRRLRAEPRTAGIPVLAVSANATGADVERARSAGFASYLTKPLELDSLLAAVRRHARRHAVGAAG